MLGRQNARADARLRTILLLTAVLAPVVAVIACSERAGAIASGGECFLATDCEPGLICVDLGEGIRTCTNDLSEVAGNPPDPMEEGDAEPNEGGNNDATTGTPDATPDVITPIVDAGEDG